MQYYSTNGISEPVSLKEAVIGGLAADGGLYMPVSLPRMQDSWFYSQANRSLKEISYDVALAFLGEDIPANVLKDIVDKAMDFPVPLRETERDLFSLELYHGPTMAFKDIGARFMSRLMSYLHRNEERLLNVIVATSGDTGSAVAAGFLNIPGINVFVLFPKDKISKLQQKQITTWGGNIYAVEVDGNFDDCQKLAKGMLGDRDLNSSLMTTSANSINIARLIPQSFYYFHAYSQLTDKNRPFAVSVPSGNFGNLTAGLMARGAGLPVTRFIASTNINDVFPRFMDTGEYSPAPSKQTISNAMDVGDPSNFARITGLMGNSPEKFHRNIISFSFTDSQTAGAILDMYDKTGYVMDPHGAVACLGLKRFIGTEGDNINAVFLETAHPAKFSETMKKIITGYDDMPPRLQKVLAAGENYHTASNDPEELKEYILQVNS